MPHDYDVVTIGDLNPDIILTGLESRAPQLGTEQYFDRMDRLLGGSGALTTVTMSRLGLRTALVAAAGDDEPGAFCRGVLEAEGVDTAHLRISDGHATGITVAIAYPEDRLLLTSPAAIASMRAEDVPRALFGRCRHIHVSALFLQTALRPGLAALLREARSAGLTTSLDTGWDPTEGWLDDDLRAALRHLTVFLPNAVELRSLAGSEDLDEAAAQLLALGMDHIAVKDGGRGSRCYTAAGSTRVEGFRITPLDTTGAGDAFNAGYVAAMLEGRPVEERLRFANACGAAVASVKGGAGGNLRRADFDAVYEGTSPFLRA